MDESSSSNASFPPPNMHESAVPEKARESSKQTADSGKDRENESAKDKSTEDKVDGKPPLEESIDEAILEKVRIPWGGGGGNSGHFFRKTLFALM